MDDRVERLLDELETPRADRQAIRDLVRSHQEAADLPPTWLMSRSIPEIAAWQQLEQWCWRL